MDRNLLLIHHPYRKWQFAFDFFVREASTLKAAQNKRTKDKLFLFTFSPYYYSLSEIIKILSTIGGWPYLNHFTNSGGFISPKLERVSFWKVETAASSFPVTDNAY